MKLLILGLNYAPEKVGIAVYTTDMAEALAAAGHEVRVIAGQPYYPAWRVMDGHSAWTYSQGKANGVSVTRVPHYIPAAPSGAKRLLHHVSFALSSLFPALWQAVTFRPDAVMTIAPSLIAAPVARLAALICGSASWLHIQDFEVEAAFATGLLKDGGRAARLARTFEMAVVRSFARVSAISPEMVQKLLVKGMLRWRVSEFRNWANVDTIQPLVGPSSYRAAWHIETKHVALYSGNIANKQGIDIVVDAARHLLGRLDMTFVICGEGPNRAELEKRAAGLPNIQFHDLQPKEKLNDLMGLATIHLLPQLARAADLVLPSKLTNMLASGRPVVATAALGTGLAREVEGCGIITKPEVSQAFAAAITRLMDDAALYETTAAAARERAVQRWSKQALLSTFASELLAISSRSRRGNVISDAKGPAE